MGAFFKSEAEKIDPPARARSVFVEGVVCVLFVPVVFDFGRQTPSEAVLSGAQQMYVSPLPLFSVSTVPGGQHS